MKYDFIYSEAVEKITQKKKDGTKFFSADTLCIIVSENDNVYRSYNESELKEGRLVSVISEMLALKKMTDSGETAVAAMITMNCATLTPVLPNKECEEMFTATDEKNKDMLIVSPEARYIKLSDVSAYVPGEDNSAIESEDRIDTEKILKKSEETNEFTFDFDAVPDDSEPHETKFLFVRPGQKAGEPEPQEQQNNDNSNGNYPYGDPSQMYMNGQYMQPGMNGQYMQPGMNGQYMQPGMNGQYMQPGMNGQYMQSGMNGQYMQPGMNGQYMQPGMNGQYMQGGVSNQYMQPGMNGQYMQPGMNGQYMQSGMNGQYMQPGMNGQYMQPGMNGQYMQPGMNGQYMQPGMNGQYMQPGMNSQYNMMNNGMYNPYMQGGMDGQYVQNQMYDTYPNPLNIPQQTAVYINPEDNNNPEAQGENTDNTNGDTSNEK